MRNYRGKRLDNGQWVYGGAQNGENDRGIIVDPFLKMIEVDKDSIGESTTKLDITGKVVYEGDQFHIGSCTGVVTFGGYVESNDDHIRDFQTEHVGFFVEWINGDSVRQDLPYWANKLEAIPPHDERYYDYKKIWQQLNQTR